LIDNLLNYLLLILFLHHGKTLVSWVIIIPGTPLKNNHPASQTFSIGVLFWAVQMSQSPGDLAKCLMSMLCGKVIDLRIQPSGKVSIDRGGKPIVFAGRISAWYLHLNYR
jgi:hypothetical protein